MGIAVDSSYLSHLNSKATAGASVTEMGSGVWRLSLPSGPAGPYRLAQMDDYLDQPRSKFPWQVPLRVSLWMRASGSSIPGTWGLGFWNDPFDINLGLGGASRHLPALPNTAWFFYASPPNYLALRDDHPAQGMLAAIFSSPLVPPLLLSSGVLFAPLLFLPATARLLRRTARKIIQEDAVELTHDLTTWHKYEIEVNSHQTRFYLDEKLCFESPIVPRGHLGLVIWIDNQYAAFRPEGVLRSGNLENPVPAWIEVKV